MVNFHQCPHLFPIPVASVELCQARVRRQLLRRQLLGRPGVALGLDVGAQIVTQPATGEVALMCRHVGCP